MTFQSENVHKYNCRNKELKKSFIIFCQIPKSLLQYNKDATQTQHDSVIR